MDEYFQTNESLWDLKTAVHLKSAFYDVAGFLAGKSSLQTPELDDLEGEVVGKTMLHLQCHFGQDSLSWTRLGAKVTGIDLSGKAIEAARNYNDQLGLDARFIKSNVYDLPNHLTGSFDIVFTSYGVITWLPDLHKWADIVDHFLRPGGIFYIVEFHPMLYLFDFDTNKISYPYFNRGKPFEETIQGTYADKESPLEAKEYFWCHSLQAVLKPLLQKGLTLLDFKEYDYSPYDCFPNMEKVEENKYRYTGCKVALPHLFSLKMRKEG